MYISKDLSSIIEVRNDFSNLEQWLRNKEYSAFYVISDENTNKFCLPHILSIVQDSPVFVFPAGEESKSLNTARALWSWGLKNNIDKSSLFIAIGGGVVCDLAGFCASVYKRGIDVIYLPTTLMAMADAAIGGKTAINLDGNKNQIGSFCKPKMIYVNPIFLETLDDRNLKNGYVEIIKHSLLKDNGSWDVIKNLQWPVGKEKILELLVQSIAFKQRITNQDFYETGLRKILNFGHTIGHAIESYYLDQGLDILHGEAIALGIIYECKLSKDIFGWEDGELKDIVRVLSNFSYVNELNKDSVVAIMEWMKADKKIKNGILEFSLLQKIAQPKINVPVEKQRIEKVLSESLLY